MKYKEMTEEQRKEYDRKTLEYRRTKYRQIKIDINPIKYNQIQDYLQSLQSSKATAIYKCIMYCRDNNINVDGYTPRANKDEDNGNGK